LLNIKKLPELPLDAFLGFHSRIKRVFDCLYFTERISQIFHGAVFLFYYVVYTSYLILMTQNYSVDTLNTVMLSFVLPLTIISAVVIFLRHNTPQSQTK
jgi:hypothetical protein